MANPYRTDPAEGEGEEPTPAPAPVEPTGNPYRTPAPPPLSGLTGMTSPDRIADWVGYDQQRTPRDETGTYLDLGDGSYFDVTNSPYAAEFTQQYDRAGYDQYTADQAGRRSMPFGMGQFTEAAPMTLEEWTNAQYQEFVRGKEEEAFAQRLSDLGALRAAEAGIDTDISEDQMRAIEERWGVIRDPETGQAVLAGPADVEDEIQQAQKLWEMIESAQAEAPEKPRPAALSRKELGRAPTDEEVAQFEAAEAAYDEWEAGMKDLVQLGNTYLAGLGAIVDDQILEDRGLGNHLAAARRDTDADPGGFAGFLGNTPVVSEAVEVASWLGGLAENAQQAVAGVLTGTGRGLGNLIKGDFEEAGETFVGGLGTAGANVMDLGQNVADPFLRGAGLDAAASASSEFTEKVRAENLRMLGADEDGDGLINAREIFGIDPEWGGLPAGAIDTLFTIATDPSTYIGIGLVGRASLGLDVAEAMFGRGVRNMIARDGLDAALTAAQRAKLVAGINDVMEATLSQKSRNIVQVIRRQDISPEGIATEAAERTARTVGQMEDGVGALSFGNRPIQSTRGLRKMYTPQAERMVNPIDDVFRQADELGEIADPAGINRLFSDTNQSMVEDVAVAPNGRQVRVKTILAEPLDGDLVPVGSSEWVISRGADDRVTAELRNVDIDEAARKEAGLTDRGLATTHIDNVLERLKRTDIDEVLFTAEADGAWAWSNPRFGAEFTDTPVTRAVLGKAMADARLMAKGGELKYKKLADRIEAALKSGDLSDVRPSDLRILDQKLFKQYQGWTGRFLTEGAPQILKEAPVNAFMRSARRTGRTPAARRFNEMFRPRSAASNKYGSATASRVERVQAEATARLNSKVESTINALGRNYAKAVDDVGRDELDELVSEVFEGGAKNKGTEIERFEAREARIESHIRDQLGRENMSTVRFLEQLRDIDRQLVDHAEKFGDAVRLEYLPRQVTKEGRDWWAKHGPRHTSAKAGLSEVSAGDGPIDIHTLERTLAPKEKVAKANEIAREVYGIPEDVKLFEENVFTAYALRTRTAYEAAAQVEVWEGVAKLTDDLGNPLGLIDDAPRTGGAPNRALQRRAERLGYNRTRELPDGRIIHTSPEIDQTLREIDAIWSDPDVVQEIDGWMRRWNDAWGRAATSPVLKGTGFHSRNFGGNIWLNYLGGVRNLRHYGDAANIQREIINVNRLAKREGIEFEAALAQVVPEGRMREVIRGARENGIFNIDEMADISRSGLNEYLSISDAFHTSVSRGESRLAAGFRATTRAADTATLGKLGREMGTLIEDNARLAHYVAKLDEGLSPSQAAASTRKYLFDYSDLTRFEQKRLRSINRFYTWHRKNMGVHLDTMWRHPGRIGRAQETKDQVFGEDREGMPEWMSRSGYVQGGLLKDAPIVGGQPVTFEDPVLGLNASVLPWLIAADLVTDPLGLDLFTPTASDKGEQGFAQQLGDFTAAVTDGWMSGGPSAAVNAFYEYLTNETVFEGDFTDPHSRTGLRHFLSLASIVVPMPEAVARFAAKVTGIDWLEQNMQISQSMQDRSLGEDLLDTMLGIKSRPPSTGQDRIDDVVGGPGTSQDGAWGLLAVTYERLQKRAEEMGLTVPTLQELQEYGLSTWSSDETKAERFEKEGRAINTEGEIEKLERRKAENPSLWAANPANEEELQELYRQREERLVEDERLGRRTKTFESGVDVTYSRGQRLKAWTESIGYLATDGTGKTDNLAKALYNREFPDDPQLDQEGNPVTYWNVPVPKEGGWVHPEWGVMPTLNDVREWVRLRFPDAPDGAFRVPNELLRAYAEDTGTPYIPGYADRVKAGFVPTQGVQDFTVEGDTYFIWPGADRPYAEDELDLTEWGPPGFTPDLPTDRYGFSQTP